MAWHLRLEAILTVPPSLPLALIITVFQPISLKMSSSREDVAAVVVRNIHGCKAESCTQPPPKKKHQKNKHLSISVSVKDTELCGHVGWMIRVLWKVNKMRLTQKKMLFWWRWALVYEQVEGRGGMCVERICTQGLSSLTCCWVYWLELRNSIN